MRISIVAAAAFALGGCIHAPTTPVGGVVVSPAQADCLPAAAVPLRLNIHNGSNERIGLYTYGPSEPPYRLYPGVFQLLAQQSGDTFAPWQVVLEHFQPATHTVWLGPGDAAAFTVEPSAWPPAVEPMLFKLEVRDTLSRPHHSKKLGLCHSSSAPNNSFKPNPLRGSA
jgi:hypothetical protein